MVEIIIGDKSAENQVMSLRISKLSNYEPHRADTRNLETQLAAMKDSESNLLQKIDMLTRDNADLQDKVKAQYQQYRVIRQLESYVLLQSILGVSLACLGSS